MMTTEDLLVYEAEAEAALEALIGLRLTCPSCGKHVRVMRRRYSDHKLSNNSDWCPLAKQSAVQHPDYVAALARMTRAVLAVVPVPENSKIVRLLAEV